MAEYDCVSITFGVERTGVVIGGISYVRHHSHVDEPQEFAGCLNVELFLVTAHGLCMELKLQVAVKYDPVDFVTTCAYRLLNSLPVPGSGKLSRPALVICFEFIKLAGDS